MLEITNELDLATNSLFLSLMSVYPGAYFKAREPMKRELEVSMRKRDLESLLYKGVNEKVISDQLLVANRANSLLNGMWGWIEDKYFTLGKKMSGNSRHSLVLMCSYGEGSPLKELKLGRYEGNDLLKGNPVDLMADDKEARRALRTIRTEEGVGLLKIFDGKYTLANSGLAFPFKGKSGEYNPSEKRGMMISSVLEFSREYHPAWFFRLNNGLSLIHNGKTYELEYD